MKTCRQCNLIKSLSDFHKDSDKQDGHVSICKSCRNSVARATYIKRPRMLLTKTQKKERGDKWRNENRDKVRAISKRWNKKNPNKLREASIKFAKENPDRIKKAKKEFRKRNPHVTRAAIVRRELSKINAIPSWANNFFISEIYDIARIRTKITGFVWHVDHIVPLRSKFVCGLHCEANLRVIPASINCSKNNRHWPDMPS